jgi:mono/diheme cytochrome c family protein
MLCGSHSKNRGEKNVMIGRGGRPAIAAWATLLTILGAAGCQKSEPPAPAATPPAPAAQPPPAPPATAAVQKIPDSTDQLAHGRYLVETIAGCGNCHTPHLPDGSLDPNMAFAGAFVIADPGFKAYARNITPDMETGIGSWTDDQIVNAIRNGQRPDGTFLGPPMSFAWYKRMSDTDVRAIVAYIRTVKPIRNEVPKSTYEFPLNGYGPMVTSVPDVPKTDIVKYGEYLAGPVSHCMDCHTPVVKGVQDLTKLGAGANVFAKPFIFEWTAIAANVTPEPGIGLGGWTDQEIKTAITTGVARDGRKLLPFMPYGLYAKAQDSDLDAIIAYLKSLPPQPAFVIPKD